MVLPLEKVYFFFRRGEQLQLFKGAIDRLVCKDGGTEGRITSNQSMDIWPLPLPQPRQPRQEGLRMRLQPGQEALIEAHATDTVPWWRALRTPGAANPLCTWKRVWMVVVFLVSWAVVLTVVLLVASQGQGHGRSHTSTAAYDKHFAKPGVTRGQAYLQRHA